MWRYAEALPVPGDERVSMGEGMTPMVPAPGRPGAWLKLDFLMPTLSFKDRGAVVLATLAKMLTARRLIVDSSGNAGTAVAAYAARAGLPCEVFVPGSTSAAKLYQMRAHGAEVRTVAGDRQAAAEAAVARLAEAPPGYYASHVYQPYFLHGTKSWAYEVWEQSGGRLPAEVLLPVGNGTLLLGAHIGFAELRDAGRASGVPRIVGVQASSCAPLARSWAGRPEPFTPAPTVAEGIAVACPPRHDQVLAAVRATGGEIVSVSEDEIVAARDDLARHGFFVEPTAAVCWAALCRRPVPPAPAGGDEDRLEPGPGVAVVVPLSGAGLKSPVKP
jgi:threonine synthase